MPQAEIRWSPQARTDLLDLYVLIGRDSPGAAEQVFNRIETKIARLSDHPRLGVRRSDIRSTLRMLIEGSYLILYHTQPNSDDGAIGIVEIVRIVDGRRDLSTLL